MKVAVVTGAARGIGLALSHVYLQKGASVVLVDKDGPALYQQEEQLTTHFPGQVHAILCDVTHGDEVVKMAQYITQHIGPVDWIFNNAGIIGSLAPVWELDVKDVSSVFDVNIYGMLHVIKAFTPYLIQQTNSSQIINIASLYALCSGSQLAAYSMSKHAILALSECLYLDLQKQKKSIDVSVVFPSFTDTSLLSHPSNHPSNSFQETLSGILAHSRPAQEVAEHIAKEVEKRQFYIFPDKEVKGYAEERIEALLHEDIPHINNIERMLSALIERAKKKSVKARY